MARLSTLIARHRLVGLDTPAFIHHFAADAASKKSASSAMLEHVHLGDVAGVTTTLTIMEVSVLPLRQGRTNLADTYEKLIDSISNLTIVSIDRASARRAAALRAEFHVATADALHLAGCMEAGATAFVTNDYRLRQVQGIKVFILDELEPDGDDFD